MDLEIPDYAIIVTAYEQTTLIPNVINSISKLNYSNYLVYIVADNCDVSGLFINNPQVVLLQPNEILASNTKSHFYAIANFKRNHNRITIIDSDNLVDQEYLTELDKVFDMGYIAIQGIREAKNLNTQYACIDEAGDIYYRYIDRKLLFESGSSASLAGSGMAFTTEIYKECLQMKQLTGAGFDKILQYELIKKKLKIAFAEHAIVYDEKTAKTDQLIKQRARWINTWFRFFILGVKTNVKSILNLNWNQFLFSLMLLRPPLFLLILVAGFLFIADFFINPLIALLSVLSITAFLFVFFKSLSFFKASDKIYDSLKNVPKFIYFQILALLKARNANKLSISTKHDNPESIDNIKSL